MTFPSTCAEQPRPGYNHGTDKLCMTQLSKPRHIYTGYTSSQYTTTNSTYGSLSSMGSAPSSRSTGGRVLQSPKLARKSRSLPVDDRNEVGKTEYIHNPNFRYDDDGRGVASVHKRDSDLSSPVSSAGRPLPQGPGPLMSAKAKLSAGKKRTETVAGKGPLRANHELCSRSPLRVGLHSLDSQKTRELPTPPLSRRKSISLTNVSNGRVEFGDSGLPSRASEGRDSVVVDHRYSRTGVFDNIDFSKARKSFQVTRSPSFDNIYSQSRAGRNSNTGSLEPVVDRTRNGTLNSSRFHSLENIGCSGNIRSTDKVTTESNAVGNGDIENQQHTSTTIRPPLSRRNSDSVQQCTSEIRARRLQRRLSQSTDDDAVGHDKTDRKVNANGLVGLRNLGNTCFMNSIIQCLSCTKQLRDYFNDDSHERDINESFSTMKGKLAIAFGRLIREIWSSSNAKAVISPNYLKSQIQRYAPRFTGFTQQDSQEFLRFLLEGLHEDLNQVTHKDKQIYTDENDISDHEKAMLSWQRYQKREKSIISDLFVGQLKSILTCTTCEKRSVTFDPFWDLSLPIPTKLKVTNKVSLYDCFNSFTQEETLDGDEKPACEYCKKRRKCIKRLLIERFPRVLVIHLKRFSEVRYRTKLSTLVEFPSELNLSKYAGNSGGSKTDVLYRLYSISNHSGATYSGHYTAYCRHPFTNDWHVFSDTRFDRISPSKVVTPEAYVLFYELQIQKSSI